MFQTNYHGENLNTIRICWLSVNSNSPCKCNNILCIAQVCMAVMPSYALDSTYMIHETGTYLLCVILESFANPINWNGHRLLKNLETSVIPFISYIIDQSNYKFASACVFDWAKYMPNSTQWRVKTTETHFDMHDTIVNDSSPCWIESNYKFSLELTAKQPHWNKVHPYCPQYHGGTRVDVSSMPRNIPKQYSHGYQFIVMSSRLPWNTA